VDVVEDEIIVDSRDPVPPEVRSAMADPSRRFGKYVLVRELGRGGVGVVYLAWDAYLSQYIALKRIHPAPPDEPRGIHEVRVQSLIQEARSAIRLRHPGIVTIYDAGRIGGDWFISMEFLEGETLEERIKASRQRGKSSPFFEGPRPVLGLLGAVARAVDYAHTRPSALIHCDLKPANILIDREERPHVLDFGLARRLQLVASPEPQVAGTPSYMAPEQARGQLSEIDARTDIYALGAILYEMLVGHPPFVGEPLDVMGRTMGEVPQAPNRVLEKEHETRHGLNSMTTRRLLRIPPALEDLCMRCLSKERADRPGKMSEVADLLEGMLKGKRRRP
jgi:serine/threonine-protein kinase